MPLTAPIFDIKRYAVHDGPGIRTTFFLKGCPLRCLWCQNPESMDGRQVVAFAPQKCVGCGECARVCGKLDDTLRLPRAQCALCGDCVKVCYAGARSFAYTDYTPERILAIALEDEPFFRASGGGVTFSGGECLLHGAFMFEALKLCHDAGIHTTVDTCGAIPRQAFEAVLPYTNLFLYDIKLMDNARHLAYTGRENGEILKNAQALCRSGAQVVIRVPLIPGHTDAAEDVRAIGRFIRDALDMRVVRVELLPYNQLAQTKYGNQTAWTDGGLGEYPLPGLETQSPEYLSSLSDALMKLGVPVYCESL